MKTLAGILLILTTCSCSHVPYANNRPMTFSPPASDLIKRCEVTVRFNEDEASVKEEEYSDSFFCLGLIEGIVSTNGIVRERTPEHALFCIPDPGIKTWLSAKVVVDFAKIRPDLLSLDESDFAVQALAHTYPCGRP